MGEKPAPFPPWSLSESSSDEQYIKNLHLVVLLKSHKLDCIVLIALFSVVGHLRPCCARVTSWASLSRALLEGEALQNPFGGTITTCSGVTRFCILLSCPRRMKVEGTSMPIVFSVLGS